MAKPTIWQEMESVMFRDLPIKEQWMVFEQMLQQHQWNFAYSDDHRKWHIHNHRRLFIEYVCEILTLVDAKTATEMYNKYSSEYVV